MTSITIAAILNAGIIVISCLFDVTSQRDRGKVRAKANTAANVRRSIAGLRSEIRFTPLFCAVSSAFDFDNSDDSDRNIITGIARVIDALI